MADNTATPRDRDGDLIQLGSRYVWWTGCCLVGVIATGFSNGEVELRLENEKLASFHAPGSELSRSD